MKLLLEEWNGFREKVIPRDASTIQLVEMKRAFYAGAEAFRRVGIDKIIAMDAADGLEAMQAIQQELVDFAKHPF